MIATTEELNEYRKIFHTYFYEKISPALQQFEELRKKEFYKYKIIISFIVLTAIIFLITILNIYVFSHNSSFGKENAVQAIIFGCILIIILLSFLAQKVAKNFENTVKNCVMSSFLSFFGDFKWSCEEFIPEQEIDESKLFDSFNMYSHDDYFEGDHKGLHFIIAEIDLKRESGSGKNRTVVQVFDGILVRISLNKNFNCQTIITANGRGLFSFLGGKLQKVELEDPEFNKMFDVLSNDQVEARVILTTAFIERFKALRNVYQAKDIRASFLNNKVTISIPCHKDMFKLGKLNVPVADAGEFQELFEEFVAILALVDLLRLDSKTGL